MKSLKEYCAYLFVLINLILQQQFVLADMTTTIPGLEKTEYSDNFAVEIQTTESVLEFTSTQLTSATPELYERYQPKVINQTWPGNSKLKSLGFKEQEEKELTKYNYESVPKTETDRQTLEISTNYTDINNSFNALNNSVSQIVANTEHWRNWGNVVGEIEDVDTWEPPLFLKNSFPYYLSGYDYENRPIWIAEYGKFPIRQFVENGQEKLMEKYVKQLIYNIVKRIEEQKDVAEEVNEIILILDFQGHHVHQLAHPPTILFILKICKLYSEFVQKVVGGAYVINADYMANTLINLVRPMLGRMLDKTEIYGTHKGKWMSVFRRTFPPKSIPTWYGGAPGYNPIEIFG